MNRIGAPILVVAGLAVLCAPLGFGYYSSAALLALIGAFLVAQREVITLPSGWLLACSLLVVLLSLNGALSLVVGPQPAAYVLQAWLAMVASLTLLVAGFLLGQRRTVVFPTIIVLYLIVRVVASPILPLGSELTSLVGSYYRVESYQLVGLGTRIILPGDVAILAGWLWTVTSGAGTTASMALRLATFAAALASFSRLMLLALVALELFYAMLVVRRHVVKVAAAGVLAMGLVAAGWIGLRNADLPVDTNGLIAARVVATSSTTTKVVQAELLADAVFRDAQSFVLGKGLGSYLPSLVRDEERPFQYEVQVLSTFHQIGVVGFVLWLVAWSYPILITAWSLWGSALRFEAWLMLATGAFFLIGGAVNPVLILPQNFVLFGVFGALYRRALDVQINHGRPLPARGSGTMELVPRPAQ